MLSSVTRKNIFALFTLGASCFVQAQTSFSGSFHVAPLLSCDYPSIEYEVTGDEYNGAVTFTIDVGKHSQNQSLHESCEPKRVTLKFATVLDALKKRVGRIAEETDQSCCGLPVNRKSGKVLDQYESAQSLLETGLRCDLKEECRCNDIAELDDFKQKMMDLLMIHEMQSDVWDTRMPRENICALISEYNLGTGVIYAVRKALDDKNEKNQKVSEISNYLLWKVYEADFRLTVAGIQSELMKANSIAKASLTGTALNGHLHERVHQSLKIHGGLFYRATCQSSGKNI